MTQQVRKWTIIIIVSTLIVGVWGLLAWKVFQLVVDDDYNQQSIADQPVIPEEPVKIDLDVEKLKEGIADSIHKIETLTDRINKGLKMSGDLEEIYLMNVEDDIENNRYVVTVKWPNLMPDEVLMEVNDAELVVKAKQSDASMTNLNDEELKKKLALSQFSGLIELPGPGLNTGTRYIMQDGILMMFIPKKQ